MGYEKVILEHGFKRSSVAVVNPFPSSILQILTQHVQGHIKKQCGMENINEYNQAAHKMLQCLEDHKSLCFWSFSVLLCKG